MFDVPSRRVKGQTSELCAERENLWRLEVPLGGVALGAVLVDVEDQVVGRGVADLEVEDREGLELAQEVDRLVEAHREGRAALGEPFDRDVGGAELTDRVL